TSGVSCVLPAMTRMAAAAAFVVLGAVGLRPQTAPSPAPPPPRQGAAIIRGRITADDTGLPIPNAHLSLTTSGAGEAVGSVEPVLSDSDGRFQFINLAAGRYTVLATKAGYLNARFGAKSYFDRPVNVVL